MRILLIEDHDEVRRMTAAHLEERGFVVDQAPALEDARSALATFRYDALVIDIGLPDGMGTDLFRLGCELPPALIVTARDEIKDRIFGLNAGADDYLPKPFSLAELEARLRAILRRPGRRAPVRMTMGRLTFDSVTREALVDAEPLPLGRRETLLLQALMEAAGRVVIRDILEERLYGFDAAVTPNALEASASRLRRVLERAGCGVALGTRRGVGYLLQTT